MKSRTVIISALLLLLTAGCEDELERLQRENGAYQARIAELTAANTELLAAQKSALRQLQEERDQNGMLNVEGHVVRGHRESMSVIVVVLGCGLAVAFCVMLRRRRRITHAS